MWIRVGVDRVVNIVIIFSPYKSIFQSVAIDILWFALVLLCATMYDPARLRIIYADKLKEYKSKKLAHNQPIESSTLFKLHFHRNQNHQTYLHTPLFLLGKLLPFLHPWVSLHLLACT